MLPALQERVKPIVVCKSLALKTFLHLIRSYGLAQTHTASSCRTKVRIPCQSAFKHTLQK